MRFSVLTIIVYCCCSFSNGNDNNCNTSNPIVNTTHGVVRGRTIKAIDKKCVNEFLGIPYAEPPVGELRYKRPKAVANWTGILDAIEFRKACYQQEQKPVVPWNVPESVTSEDCLYLNIWQPETLLTLEQRLKPILIWIHGGGLKLGTASVDLYNASVLATTNDVIVVTFNYRLGEMGFLYGNHSDVPGNMAMWDQYFAIKWISQNAKQFGGDPEKITLFGESAGAVSVSAHAISPLTRPLVKNFIAQSGSLFWKRPFISDLKRLKFLGETVGCNKNDDSRVETMIECLRSKSTQELSLPENKKWAHPNLMIGDEFLPDEPQSLALKQSKSDNKSLLIGLVRDEGSFFLLRMDPNSTRDDYGVNETHAKTLLSKLWKEENIVDALLDKYVSNATNDKERLTVLKDIISAGTLSCAVDEFSRLYRGGHIFTYKFNYLAEKYDFPWPKWMGVTHFVDVEFVFGMPIRHPERYNDVDRKVSQHVMQAWTSFASDGRPTVLGTPWPEYSLENPVGVVFDQHPPRIESTHLEICDFLRNAMSSTS